MTLAQQRALAMASARLRLQGQAQPQDARAAGAAASIVPGDQALSGGSLEAALMGLTQGLSFGLVDEANAALRAGYDRVVNGKPFGEAYDDRLAQERAVLHQARDENPVATTAGEIAGAVALPVGGAASATTLPAAMARGAVAGGSSGAAYGFGQAENGVGERLKGAAEGGALGALFGAGANAAVNVGGRAVRKLTSGAMERPSIEALQDAKNAAYKAVDDAGEVFQPAEVQGMAKAVREATEGSGFYVADVDKQTRAVLDMLDANSSKPLTLGQLDKLRQNAWKRYNAAPNEDNILDAIDAIDELITSRQGSSELMTAARAANTRYKKAELLDAAFKRARDETASTGSGGNILNKYRQAVTRIINNPKQAKWFNDEEKAVMQRMIDGSVGENLLRRIGKLSPSGNGLMQALNLVAAAKTGGASLAVSGAAAGAKELSDRSGMRMAEKLQDTVAMGPQPAPLPVEVPGWINRLVGQQGARATDDRRDR